MIEQHIKMSKSNLYFNNSFVSYSDFSLDLGNTIRKVKKNVPHQYPGGQCNGINTKKNENRYEAINGGGIWVVRGVRTRQWNIKRT